MRLLLATAAAAAGVAASSAAAGAPTGHFSFVLRQFTPTGFVDNPPKARNRNDFGVGDVITAHSTVYDKSGKHRIGRTSELCIVTVLRPFTADCSISLLFSYGAELVVRGAFDPSSTPWRAVVAGGYGRYAGARGWVRETDVKGGERMSGVLLP